MQLHDTTIGHVAKLVQMAILTGTDVTDHLRMMILEPDGDKLVLDQEYQTIFEEQVSKMLNNSKEETSQVTH